MFCQTGFRSLGCFSGCQRRLSGGKKHVWREFFAAADAETFSTLKEKQPVRL
jgi:hypothetical protein